MEEIYGKTVGEVWNRSGRWKFFFKFRHALAQAE